MSGMFSTFNIAVRGMSAQQTALDVTTHNIANANTVGYSRQRANLEATTPFGAVSMNNAAGVGQLGTGVQVSSITRIRDDYLDYRVRAQNGALGSADAREEVLSEVEGVFNGLSDTGISNSLDNVYNAWQTLSKSPEVASTRTVVTQQSKVLTDQLNSTYNQLVTLKGNAQDVIKQDVVDINSMLDQVNQLNQQVINVKISGAQPNDLMDKRDLLLDQLSVKFGITIDKKNLSGEDLKPTDFGDMDNAYLVKSDPNDEVNRFSYVSSIVPSATQPTSGDASYDITYYKGGDTTSDANKVTMTMTLSKDQYTSLDQGRVLWADKEGYAINNSGSRLAGKEFIGSDSSVGTNVLAVDGGTLDATTSASGYELFESKTGELSGYTTVQTDINSYIEQLNSLAKGIAFSVNAVESGESDASNDSIPFFVNKDAVGNEAGITAGNITVNSKIINDVTLIKTGVGDTAGTDDGTRALAIADLRDVKLDIQGIGTATTRAQFLNGNFDVDATTGISTIGSLPNGMTASGYFTNTVNNLGVKTQAEIRNVTNNESSLSSLEESRSSVSGVSLDEEMANMIQYQHAYAANAKIISTVDELLDLIINGLKK